MTPNRSTGFHHRTLGEQNNDKVEYYLDFLDDSTATIEQNEYTPENDPLLHNLIPCTGYTAVPSLMSNGVIVAGFYIMGDYSNWAFDKVNHRWQSLSPLPRFRTNHKAVKSKEYIWLFGGVSNNSTNNNNDKQLEVSVKEIDIYHVLFNDWITISPTSGIYPFFWSNDDQEDIEIVEAFVLDETNIYIVTYNHNNHTNAMWMINSDNILSQFHDQNLSTEFISQPTTTPHNNIEIISREAMAIPRGAGVTLKPLMSRYVFAIGGNTHDEGYTCTVEVYDAKYNQWATLRQPLKHCRSFANVLMFNDILYVFGGDQKTHLGKFPSSSWTERYDPHSGISGSWDRVRTSFPSNKLSWDYVTLMASSQLQTWYLLTSQKTKLNEDSPSFLCQHKLYISQSPKKKSITKWTKIKHSIQDYMDNSSNQKYENDHKLKLFIIIALLITSTFLIIIVCFCYRRRRYRREQTQIQVQEQSPLSISEFELA